LAFYNPTLALLAPFCIHDAVTYLSVRVEKARETLQYNLSSATKTY